MKLYLPIVLILSRFMPSPYLSYLVDSYSVDLHLVDSYSVDLHLVDLYWEWTGCGIINIIECLLHRIPCSRVIVRDTFTENGVG